MSGYRLQVEVVVESASAGATIKARHGRLPADLKAEAVRRSTAKVEQSRAATALLHSEAALAPGDLTRAGTARGAGAGAGGGGARA